METRIIKSNFGGISKALYIPLDPEAQIITYYNAGKAGVDYRFLEYGASYFTSSSSDFNILDYLSNEQIKVLYETSEAPLLEYDELENIYNTAVPCSLGENNPEVRNYFGSFVVSQRTIYAFIVPPGIQKIRLYQDINAIPDLEVSEEEDCDLFIDFGPAVSNEVKEAKVVYISVSQVDGNSTGEVQVSYKSWLQLLNPIRKKPDSLVSKEDQKIGVRRVEKVGDAWFDMASGTILGNKVVSHPILDKKLSLIDSDRYSQWRVYRFGETVKYPIAFTWNLEIAATSTSLINVPAGEVCLYGLCNISDIILCSNNNNNSIRFSPYYESTDQIEGTAVYNYITEEGTSLTYRRYIRPVISDSGSTPTPTPPNQYIELREGDKDRYCVKFNNPIEGATIVVETVPGSGCNDNTPGKCLIYEYPVRWKSLKEENIGNTPNILSSAWTLEENLTNYFTDITEIVCSHGTVSPSGNINIIHDQSEINAILNLRPGWDIQTDSQMPGVSITKRRNQDGETYYYISITNPGDALGGWQRKYEIETEAVIPEVYFNFPILITNSNQIFSENSPVRVSISEFYNTPGNLDDGISINIKEKIREISEEEYNVVPDMISLSDYLDTQEFEISPSFPGMTFSTPYLASASEVSVLSGEYTISMRDKDIVVLMANSYDFSVSNPYDKIEYGSIVNGLSFKSETGKIPGYIWIDKKLDDQGEPIKISLSDLNNELTNQIIIDGGGYNFTKMIITKEGEEYFIKIEDIKNTTKIDIMEEA